MKLAGVRLLALLGVCAGAFSPPPHATPRRLGWVSARAAAARPRSAATLDDAEEGVRLIADLTGVVDDRCIPRLAGLLSGGRDATLAFPAGDEMHGGVRFCCWDDVFEDGAEESDGADQGKPNLLFLPGLDGVGVSGTAQVSQGTPFASASNPGTHAPRATRHAPPRTTTHHAPRTAPRATTSSVRRARAQLSGLVARAGPLRSHALR